LQLTNLCQTLSCAASSVSAEQHAQGSVYT